MKRRILSVFLMVVLLTITMLPGVSAESSFSEEHEHSYFSYVAVEPTCTASGEEVFECDCGDSYSAAIAPLGHDFVDGVCVRCGERVPAFSDVQAREESETAQDASEGINTEIGDEIITEAATSEGYSEETMAEQEAWDGTAEEGESSLQAEGEADIPQAGDASDFTVENGVLTAYNGAGGDVVIPDDLGITKIAEKVFYNCTSLTSVVIPDCVTYIYDGAFQGCTSLTSVTLPNTLTTITNNLFYKCSSLTSVSIPNSVAMIFSGAFDGCTSLQSVTIPNNVKVLGTQAFRGCTSLAEAVISENITKIPTQAFAECSSLTSIVIPNGVTEIGNSVFNGCSSLASITIGNSVTSIGEDAFNGCSSLTTIDIPDSVTFIGDSAFYRCSSLASIIISDGVTSIGDDTFSFCTSLTSITIPGRVKSIGYSAFSHCTNLATITLPNSLTSIDDSAFRDCGSLTSIEIPEGVTSIGDSAFADCKNLTSITIPGSLRSIGDYAFGSYGADCCSKLQSVYTPSIEAWLSIAFGNFASNPCFYKAKLYINGEEATNITIPDGVIAIGECAFYNLESLTSVTIPGSVTSIGRGAFERCSSLTTITIPDSVTRIGNYAFEWCSALKSVTIPASVTSIGIDAFRDCDLLTIYGYTSSYAQTYAQENDIPFVALDGEPTDPPTPEDPPEDPEVPSLWNKLSSYEQAQLTFHNTIYIEKGGQKDLDDYIELWKWFDGVDGGHEYSIAKKDSKYAKYVSIDTKTGTIKGIKAGKTAYVTVKLSGGKTERFSIVCYDPDKPYAVASVYDDEGNEGFMTLDIMDTKSVSLKADVFPSSAKNQNVTWKSSKPKVLKVSSDGKLTPVTLGRATITCKATAGGKPATIVIEVIDSRIPASFTLNVNDKQTVDLWDELTIVPKVEPATAAQYTKYKYTISKKDKAVAEITEDGVLKLHKTGTAKITVTTSNTIAAKYKMKALSKTFTLTVKDSTAPTEISINEKPTWCFDALMVMSGTSYQLTYKLGEPTERAEVTWTSSNPSLVQVDPNTGMLTAVKVKKDRHKESATITVKTHNKKSATLKVRVYDPDIPLKIWIDKPDTSYLVMNQGTQFQLSYKVFPDTANCSVNWSAYSSTKQKGIVEIDQNGVVTAKRGGDTTITVTTDNNVKANFPIRVVPDSFEVTIGENETVLLRESTNPSNEAFTWTSADPSIADVNSIGVVTGNKGGTVAITATTTYENTTEIMTFIVVVNPIIYRLMLDINYQYPMEQVLNAYQVEYYKRKEFSKEHPIIGFWYEQWIGNNAFWDGGLGEYWYPSPAKVNDGSAIEALYQEFITDRGQLKEDIHYYKDINKSEVLRLIPEVFKDSDYNDVNIFYYGGHGYEANELALPNWEFISPVELFSRFQEVDGNSILILSGCYTGGFANTMEKYPYKKAAVLAACEADHLSHSHTYVGDDGSRVECSCDAYTFLRGLGFDEPSKKKRNSMCADYDHDGKITVEEICAYMERNAVVIYQKEEETQRFTDYYPDGDVIIYSR